MLPGIRPSHTRGSFSSRSRLYVEIYAPTPEDYLLTDEGLWLLPETIAERDRKCGEAILRKSAEVQEAAEMMPHARITKKAARILGNTAITSMGCMVGGLKVSEDPNKWALQIADLEFGGIILTEPEDMEHVKTCGNPDCYNTRHFELDYGKPTTLSERQHELNPNWFITAEDGTIKTVWGDKLPSIKESLEYYIQFQHKNFPFVPLKRPKGEKGPVSKLTPTPMAQIRFHPVTGCWESWKYYSKKSSDSTKNGRFDGYGQMYEEERVVVDKATGEILRTVRRGGVIAHRLIWRKSGRWSDERRVLNHLCNYKRCCNPLHLKQGTVGENNSHGNRVTAATNLMIAANPEIKKQFLSAEEMAPYHKAALELYHEIAA